MPGRRAATSTQGGLPTHPDWYYNLKANPKIKAEVGTQTFTVLAEELDDTQAVLDLRRVLEERDEELAAARETNRRLMNQLNRSGA